MADRSKLYDNPRSQLMMAGEPEEGPPDFTDQFNTKLSKKDEEGFQAFVAKRKEETGRDLSRDLADYDVRGWWKEGAETSENGHGPDTYKKPNHPTFSNESKYHSKENKGGAWGKKNGRDTFTPGSTNKKHWSTEDRARYFKEREPDVDLIEGDGG